MIDTLKPAHINDNPIMQAAFASFINWIWSQNGAHEQFCAETGTAPWPIKRSPIDAMIDKSTGREKAYSEAFFEWAVKSHWGEEGDETDD